MMRALQVMESARDENEAREMLAGLALQDGYLGGRVLEPSASEPNWRVQGFMDDEPEADWLPDGVRRVVVPEGQRRALGLR